MNDAEFIARAREIVAEFREATKDMNPDRRSEEYDETRSNYVEDAWELVLSAAEA
jgi:hypothetical protein